MNYKFAVEVRDESWIISGSDIHVFIMFDSVITRQSFEKICEESRLHRTQLKLRFIT